MDTLSLQFGPYSFLSVLLFFLGGTSVTFLARFKHKTLDTWLMIAALAGFTASTLTMFLVSSLVLWGSAFWPLQDAWVIFCMAAVIGIIYNYPEKNTSLEAWLAWGFAVSALALAFGYSCTFAWKILVNHEFRLTLNPLYPYWMPAVLILTLGLTLRRMFVLYGVISDRRSPPRGFLMAFISPPAKVRTFRNISLALAVSLLQGVAPVLWEIGLLSMAGIMYAIGFSLLAVIMVLIYSSWDHAPRQPGLMVKLIGLTLVTVLAILGAIGIFMIHEAISQSKSERLLEVEIARQAIQSGDLSALPVAIQFIVARPDLENTGQPARLVYGEESQVSEMLLAEINSRAKGDPWPIPLWSYYYDYSLAPGRFQRAVTTYFGSHPAGSYSQFLGYSFNDSHPQELSPSYEVIFDLAKASTPMQQASLTMIGVVLLCSIFILTVFPLFFRTSITAPLGRLLNGVTQANTGDLNVAVPVSQNDEIGFLTQSFNAMVASIRTQVEARQQKEVALQELTATLEQHIASRTRELRVLYDISATASQSQTVEMLINRSLAQTIQALDSELGIAFLIEPSDDQVDEDPSRTVRTMRRVACQGVNTPTETFSTDHIPLILPATHELFAALFHEPQPLLVYNIAADRRIPEGMRRLGQRSLLAAPLRAEDRVLGALVLIHRPGSTFRAEEVALLGSIADQVGISVHSSRLRQQAVVLEERQRLARDLHDSVTQVLYGLVTLAEAGQVRMSTGSLGTVRPTFERIAAAARQALNEMRLFVHRLRPPELEQHGLAAALNQRVAAVEGWSGVQIRLLTDESIHLPPDVEAGLYQIAQEALNNALRHAHASAITVKLQAENAENTAGPIVLEISDNGCGFDLEQGHGRGLGLTHMAERARNLGADFQIITAPTEGTRVRVTL